MGAAKTKSKIQPTPAPSSLEPVPEYRCKIKILGDQTVGKSSLVLRFFEDSFHKDWDKFYLCLQGCPNPRKCSIDFGPFKAMIEVWDHDGGDRFRPLNSGHYKRTAGAMLVYDVTNPETFENTIKWMEELERYAGNEKPVKFLIGNKIDLKEQRKVSEATATEIADKFALELMYTSARDNFNVTESFVNLAYKCTNPYVGEEEGRYEKEEVAYAKRQLFLRYGNPEIILFLKYTDLNWKAKSKTRKETSFSCLPREIRDLIALTYVRIGCNKLRLATYLALDENENN